VWGKGFVRLWSDPAKKGKSPEEGKEGVSKKKKKKRGKGKTSPSGSLKKKGKEGPKGAISLQTFSRRRNAGEARGRGYAEKK